MRRYFLIALSERSCAFLTTNSTCLWLKAQKFVDRPGAHYEKLIFFFIWHNWSYTPHPLSSPKDICHNWAWHPPLSYDIISGQPLRHSFTLLAHLSHTEIVDSWLSMCPCFFHTSPHHQESWSKYQNICLLHYSYMRPGSRNERLNSKVS